MAGGKSKQDSLLKHQEDMTRKEKQNGHNCEFKDLPSRGFPSYQAASLRKCFRLESVYDPSFSAPSEHPGKGNR